MPTGVSMLPRLAATVCRLTTQGSSPPWPLAASTSTAKGTKVMRATSLVTSMEEKKQSITSTRHSPLPLPLRLTSADAIRRKAPACSIPATTAIRQ